MMRNKYMYSPDLLTQHQTPTHGDHPRLMRIVVTVRGRKKLLCLTDSAIELVCLEEKDEQTEVFCIQLCEIDHISLPASSSKPELGLHCRPKNVALTFRSNAHRVGLIDELIGKYAALTGDELLVKKASEDYCRITQTTPFLKMTIRDTTRFATKKTSLWCGTKALLDSERHRRKALLDSEKHRRNSQAAVSRTPSPPPPPLPMGPPGILLDVDIHGLRKHLSHLLQNNWRSRACAESIRQWQLSIDTASDEGSVRAEYHRINHMMTALGAQGYFLHPRRDKKRLTNRTL